MPTESTFFTTDILTCHTRKTTGYGKSKGLFVFIWFHACKLTTGFMNSFKTSCFLVAEDQK